MIELFELFFDPGFLLVRTRTKDRITIIKGLAEVKLQRGLMIGALTSEY